MLLTDTALHLPQCHSLIQDADNCEIHKNDRLNNVTKINRTISNKYTFQPPTESLCDLLIFVFPSGRNRTAKSIECDSVFEVINVLFSGRT